MNKTIKCPHCGSSEVSYYKEEARFLLFKIGKNGDWYQFKSCIKTLKELFKK